ncbi:hypothetical protein EDB80DRAFT_891108 [Ilyonectria destructans]|nr:hypothetical protein EDB80DRAFT_891108 [Ilyonectria destructans]
MESRGNPPSERCKSRPPIARRSCDHCRARKVGCDRGSPCSNCVSAKLNCTHSTIASNTITPKQRVIISSQYEKKIDHIAKSIDDIKLLLERLSTPSEAEKVEPHSPLVRSGLAKPLAKYQPIATANGEHISWDHSAYIVGFVDCVAEYRGVEGVPSGAGPIISSLRNMVQILARPDVTQDSTFTKTKTARDQTDTSPMPPLEATVAALRWVKAHEQHPSIAWISHILSHGMFAEICKKVYFAIEDYIEVDFTLANGYLSYVFAARAAESGELDYREYWELCRDNLFRALSRLPMILPTSIEAVAALALGAYNAVEILDASRAWTFISNASDLSQRLGYHRQDCQGETDQSLRLAEERLFWTIYRLEKALSLRFGKSSTIDDTKIILPSFDSQAPRLMRLGRIRGRVDDQLHSPISLACSGDEGGNSVEHLAAELREVVRETHLGVLSASDESSESGQSSEMGSIQVVNIQCELAYHCSLLALILRAISTAGGSLEHCFAIARDILDIHHQCIISLRGCENDAFMISRHLDWSILYTPFVPFSILFPRTVQLSDLDDLTRLERFAASFGPDEGSYSSTTQLYQLYQLLSQAARLYIQAKAPVFSINSTFSQNLPDLLREVDFDHLVMEAQAVANGTFEVGDSHTPGLSGWDDDNQQLMDLIDDEMFSTSGIPEETNIEPEAPGGKSR